MTRILDVSRSGYYCWLTRKPSVRQEKDKVLKGMIKKVHELSRGTYGPIRIKEELSDRGVSVGRDRIGRLRSKMGLRCVQKRKFKATTNSSHTLPVAPNLLNQDFDIRTPGTVYGADITYIRTDEGWLYLAGVKDFCTREIIGYDMGDRMTKDLVCNALERAFRYRKPKPGCICHSDRGSQYCSQEYTDLIVNRSCVISMSRKGNCYDNAPTESFWGVLKQEMVNHRRFRTRLEAKAAIQEWIEVFYNRIRRHSGLGYTPPAIWAENISNRRAA